MAAQSAQQRREHPLFLAGWMQEQKQRMCGGNTSARDGTTAAVGSRRQGLQRPARENLTAGSLVDMYELDLKDRHSLVLG